MSPTNNPFQQATKSKSKLRLALMGPAGSGKSYTALILGARLAESAGGRMAVIDTESGSASLYADLFPFDVLELDSYHPQRYIDAIHAAEQAGYPVIVIDSLSHAWAGKDGALMQVDNIKARNNSSNSFTAWRDVTPLQEELVHAMIGSKAHIIATMRVKTEYVMEAGPNGKMAPRKVGLAPVQRDQIEYEFTLAGDIDTEHKLVITKSRIPALADQVYRRPDASIADTLITWLDSGAEPSPVEPKQQPAVNGHTNGSAPAQVSDLYHDAPTDPDAERKRFWATATDLGYVTPVGKLSKVRVHEALGVEVRDQALAEAVAAGRYTYASALDVLRQKAITRPDPLPFEASIDAAIAAADADAGIDNPPMTQQTALGGFGSGDPDNVVGNARGGRR